MEDKITSVVIYGENLAKLNDYLFKSGETRTKLINRLLKNFLGEQKNVN